jgi:hypothetical protein
MTECAAKTNPSSSAIAILTGFSAMPVLWSFPNRQPRTPSHIGRRGGKTLIRRFSEGWDCLRASFLATLETLSNGILRLSS